MPPVDIQWCDHSAVLIEYLRQLYDDGRFVDVGLECEGRQVKAHKAVISACSPYLEGLLKGNPARSHLIKFNGYSFRSLRSVIDFMYNGKVMVEQEQLAAFLKLGRALQVRGILDIAAQCEEAGLTTPEETKSNAQYSTTVQQSQQKLSQQQQRMQQQADSKKYAYLVDKNNTGNQSRKSNGSSYRKGSVDQNTTVNKNQNNQPVLQQAVSNQPTDGALEELQQALVSGQTLIHSADGTVGEQTLQMMEGQCVVTGAGQTYVVVQEGENLSFVPAEMVQGDLTNVNGGQVMETLDVEQRLAEIEGQTFEQDQIMEGQGQAVAVSSQDSGTLDTMTVVESLVKLGEKPGESVEQPEIGADMPCIDGDLAAATPQVGADMPDLLPPEQCVAEDDDKDKKGMKRKADTSPGGKGKKAKN